MPLLIGQSHGGEEGLDAYQIGKIRMEGKSVMNQIIPNATFV
jgi:hypothetical protein